MFNNPHPLPPEWDDPYAEEPDFWTRWLTGRRAWVLVVVVGFLLFELTADPVLGVLVACMKYGWDELQLSRQLRRHDPVLVRGRVCARFYEAYALWKVSLVAFGMMFLVIMVHEGILSRLKPPGQPRAEGPPRGFIAATLLMLAGFTLAGVVSLLAVISALLHRLRVWVGRRNNRLKAVLLVVSLFWFTPVLLLLVLGIFPHLGIAPGQIPPAVVGLGIVLIFVLIFPVGLLLLLGWLESRIAALAPHECWPELLLPPELQPEFLHHFRA